MTQAVPRLEADEREQAAHAEVLAGRRHPCQAMLANLKAALATERAE